MKEEDDDDDDCESDLKRSVWFGCLKLKKKN